MRPLYIVITLLPIFVMGVEDVTACNCEHCDEEKVIGLGEKETTTQAMYAEDSDNDDYYKLRDGPC
ncbi:uncharacterized protein LOC105836401 isoform X2 [Monomorium pharaonis]|uniref:uncharacterized protein LOC105836401 isoform X2 n=1 Tax=Monomorium pharaonis TaxID=307658 RepID=UPI00063FAC4A|nr:uncharacterized protein LOC105836401 isoform X2 [Monomorium pharaonis]